MWLPALWLPALWLSALWLPALWLSALWLPAPQVFLRVAVSGAVVTSSGIGTMGLAALFFQFSPASVEVIQGVLSRVQRGLRAY